MKKADPEALALFKQELPEDDAQELAPVIPIRTETALTRYPFHRIAKKVKVLIKQTSKNEKGKVITTWEVKHPPGPLGYKLDTLIINRRIDEMRARGEIRQLFKLGSLRDICKELGIKVSGQNVNGIKEALRENAFAGITCKLEFTGNDGATRDFEFNTTRYTVIFTGEKLPNEKRADAVYIELHPRFYEMLKHSQTRPLDYKYLRELAPAPQRLYEILSFSIYATLKYGLPNAQLIYSEFCQSAPLTRHHEIKKMHSQMWKIHKPHIKSGYIKSVEFQETTDNNGEIDWVMKYTPGRRARHEFRASVKNTENLIAQKEAARPRLVKPKAKESPPAQKDERETELSKRLRDELGISTIVARTLETTHSERALHWCEAKKYSQEVKDKGAGFFVRAIMEGWELPTDYKKIKARSDRRAAEEQEQKINQAKEAHWERYSKEYLTFAVSELERISQEHPKAFQKFEEGTAEERTKYEGFGLSETRILEAQAMYADWFFNDGYWKKYQIPFTGFWEWDEKHNPEKFSFS